MTRLIATALVLALAAPAITHAQGTLTVVRGTPLAQLAPAENFTGSTCLNDFSHIIRRHYERLTALLPGE